MLHPTKQLSIAIGLDGFMDEINILHGDYNNNDLSCLLQMAQSKINLWQDLLQVSSSSLNPLKCSWSPFIWSFNSLGNACLESIDQVLPTLLTAKDR